MVTIDGYDATVATPEQVAGIAGYGAVVLGSAVYADHRVFAGKLERHRLSFPERAITIALRVPDGDFRDWTAIRSWATGIAQALSSP